MHEDLEDKFKQIKKYNDGSSLDTATVGEVFRRTNEITLTGTEILKFYDGDYSTVMDEYSELVDSISDRLDILLEIIANDITKETLATITRGTVAASNISSFVATYIYNINSVADSIIEIDKKLNIN
jgi:hypothetical protein